MKIEDARSLIRDYTIQAREIQTPEQASSFKQFLHDARAGNKQEALGRLMQEIDAQGERLSHSRSIQDLVHYKHLVRQWIDLAVKEGLALEDRAGWDRRGRGKLYKIIAQVDQKLLELTEEVLDQEKNRIEILEKIGEIKGLLINLYL